MTKDKTTAQAATRRDCYYPEYLRLDLLLSAQQPESMRLGAPAHDEMLFIVVHQVYELWFKQILFELDAVQGVFAADRVDDRAIGRASRALHRIHEILKLGVHQLDVLETMTPLDFLDFRDLLIPFHDRKRRIVAIRCGERIPSGISLQARRESLYRCPAPHIDDFHDMRLARIRHDEAVSRNHAQQLMELPLNRGQNVGIDIRVVVLEVVQHCRSRAVVHELRALIEESRVVLVGLDDEVCTVSKSRRRAEIARHAADQETRIQARVLENPG